MKFYKAGKWRYVHIDDHIPCRQSGKVHYTRNANPNETFAILIEKAYAKLLADTFADNSVFRQGIDLGKFHYYHYFDNLY